MFARAEVTRSEAGYQLDLSVTTSSGTTRKRLSSAQCDTFSDVIALEISLAVLSGTTRAALADRPERELEPASESGVVFSGRAMAGAGSGPGPWFAPALSFAAALRWRALRIELGGSYGPELTKRYAADSGIGARIESFTGNARGCYALATVDEERGDLRAWLFTIARQVSQHARRASARRERRQHSVLSFPEDGNPHATLERSRAAQFVNQFLAELDSKQSDVFT